MKIFTYNQNIIHLMCTHTKKLLHYSVFIPSHVSFAWLVSSDYEIWGVWTLHFEMAQALLDPSFMTHWHLQQWSFSSPCVDRRKHLTSSCTGRVHRSHAVWPHLQAQEKHDCWSCVYSSNSWSASSGSGKKTPPARWKHPRGWAVCGMIQITAPVSLDSVIWHNIHNGNQESSHSTFRTILISFFITWAHLYPWDLILIFFPVSDVIQNPKIHCFIYLCQWRNLFSINCRNGNQMIRTSSQSFSHINCPIFKVIVLSCHPSHSPPVWQNCNCGRKLCRKR